MSLDEINKLKELWFAGEIELLKVLMEGAGLKYLNLDLYELMIKFVDIEESRYEYYESDPVIMLSINKKMGFRCYSENIIKGVNKPLRECNFDITITDNKVKYDFIPYYKEYSYSDNDFIQVDLTTLNKIIFELPLDYEPTEIEML